MINNSTSVQSPTFGAYRCAEPKAFREALNNLSTKQRDALAKQIIKAKQKLEQTKYADAVTYVREGNIVHRCEIRNPRMNADGTITTGPLAIGCDFPSLKAVMKQTLQWEKNAQKEAKSLQEFEYLI